MSAVATRDGVVLETKLQEVASYHQPKQAPSSIGCVLFKVTAVNLQHLMQTRDTPQDLES